MSEWTFLTNHALVLSVIANNPRSTAFDISQRVGITERSTRKIIADLDEDGYIDKKKQGRRVRYRINSDLSLRSDTHRGIVIGDFLESLGWNERKRSISKDRAQSEIK